VGIFRKKRSSENGPIQETVGLEASCVEHADARGVAHDGGRRRARRRPVGPQGTSTDTPGGGTFSGFNKSARSAHVNLIFSPVPRVNLGMELIGERRTVVDGDFGTLRRVQFAAQYWF